MTEGYVIIAVGANFIERSGSSLISDIQNIITVEDWTVGGQIWKEKEKSKLRALSYKRNQDFYVGEIRNNYEEFIIYHFYRGEMDMEEEVGGVLLGDHEFNINLMKSTMIAKGLSILSVEEGYFSDDKNLYIKIVQGNVTELPDDRYMKVYNEVDDDTRKLLKEAYIFLSFSEMGPKLIEINEDSSNVTFITEKVETISDYLLSIEGDTEKREALKDKMFAAICRLHELDWVHGDLNIGNWGLKNGEVIFLDPDSMFRLNSNRKNLSILKVIEIMIDNKYTFDEYLEYELYSWMEYFNERRGIDREGIYS